MRPQPWLAVLGATVVAGSLAATFVQTDSSHAEVPPGTAAVTGQVFADLDEDGTRDNNEPGIPNVAIADGDVVKRSDHRGKYALTVNTERRKTDLVFVSSPAGFVPAPDADNIPRFYAPVTPDAAGNATVDFALRPNSDSTRRSYRFVGLADVHVQAGTTNNKERFGGQVAQINKLIASSTPKDRPLFSVVSGDLTNNATLQEFADFRAGAKVSTVPVWPAIGNHEYFFQSGNTYADLVDNYRQSVGPEWYSFSSGDRHFVMLDNIQGLNQPDQLRWLEQDLALVPRWQQVVVITHIPINTPQATTVDKLPALVKLLEKHNTKLLLAGHTHSNDIDAAPIKGALHAVTTSSSYTIDQTPNGFRVVSFKGNRINLPFREYNQTKNLTLVNPAPGGSLPRSKTAIEVNAYDTSLEVASARYRIDNGGWRSLSAVGDWTWTAPVDARSWRLGSHQIAVETIGTDGTKSRQEGSFTVVSASTNAAPAQGAPWTAFHGNPAHTGLTSDAVKPPLRLAWTHFTRGKILTGSPAVVDGGVYIGVRDENDAKLNAVHALDLATGKLRWSVQADGQVEGTPSVVDGMVYATSIRGTVYAINAATGKVKWSYRAGNPGDRVWMYQAPTVVDGVIYQSYSTGAGTALEAIDAATGTRKWIANSGIGGNWHSFGTAAVADGLVVHAAQGGLLSAFDTATGTRKWAKAPAGGWTRTAPVLADGQLLMTFQGDIVVALDPSTGVERWRYKSPGKSFLFGDGTASAPAVSNGVAYVSFADGSVTALDLATGLKSWSHQTGHGVISSPAVSGDVVYVGGNDGFVRALDAATGAEQWKHRLGPWVASSPAVSGNALVIGAYDGNVYAFTSAG